MIQSRRPSAERGAVISRCLSSLDVVKCLDGTVGCWQPGYTLSMKSVCDDAVQWQRLNFDHCSTHDDYMPYDHMRYMSYLWPSSETVST